jgi:hypothetical protein
MQDALMPLQDGWWLCRKVGCLAPVGTIPGLRNETLVVQWLQSLRLVPSRMLEMRSLLAAELGSASLFLMSDQTVLRQVGRLVAADKIHLHYPELTETLPQGGSVEPAKPAPPPRAPRPPAAAPFREPPVESPTFSTDIDRQAQVATLTAAADSGKPFCPE